MKEKKSGEKRRNELKDLLLNIKRKILSDIHKSIEGSLNEDIRLSFEILKDNADKSTDELIKHVSATIIGNKSEMLDKIDKALDKVKDGTYGICEECGSDIPLERLKAVVFATHCVSCQGEEERKAKEENKDMQTGSFAGKSIDFEADEE
jgi:DnaK suppressor protein